MNDTTPPAYRLHWSDGHGTIPEPRARVTPCAGGYRWTATDRDGRWAYGIRETENEARLAAEQHILGPLSVHMNPPDMGAVREMIRHMTEAKS